MPRVAATQEGPAPSRLPSPGRWAFASLGFQPVALLVANAVRRINEYHKMPDNDVWPPKPDLPDPLTEYDEVIAAKIAALPEARRNRFALIRALRDEEGIDLRLANALSKSYGDRHGLFVTGRAGKVFAWGGCVPAGVAMCLAFFNTYLLLFRREAVMSQPHHRAALLALDRQELAVVAAIMLLTIVSATVSVASRRLSHRRK